MTDGRLCAAAFELDGTDFREGGSREDIAVCKIKPDGTMLEYQWAAGENEYVNGRYTILDEAGNIFHGRFDGVKKYTVVLFIADNGDFDLDNRAGVIVDPTAIATFKKYEKENSGGGCSAAGVGVSLLAALIFAIPAVLRRKG